MSEPYSPPAGLWPLPRRGAAPVVAAVVAALAALAAGRLPLGRGGPPVPAWVEAAAVRAEAAMRDAEAFLWRAKTEAGLASTTHDPGRSGLIGEEYNALTTTLGALGAKRTATDPLWASALTRRLWASGVREGSLVAAGVSGSFPGLALALALACEALGARLGAISSVTASTWGANQAGFTWPEMEARLAVAGLLEPVSIGVAVGGSGDAADDLEPEARALASAIAERSAQALGARLLDAGSYAESVAARMALYSEWAGGSRMALYVNVGGAEASVGRSEAILELGDGFAPGLPFDRSRSRERELGVMALMAERGVPILSLLDVRGLALGWGVPVHD